MKEFLKYVLATITGIVVLGLLVTISSVVTLLGMSMQSSTVPVPDNAVLTIKLNGTLAERAEDNPFAQIFGNSAMEEMGLDDMLAAVNHAAENDKVKGIYLEAGSLSGATPAMLEELRHALVEFKKSGKFIVSYGDTYTQGTYYVCSVSDSILINPQGMLDWKGLSMQSVFVKDLLDKVGVKMQVFKVGTYKSAVEPVILNEMSEANREQLTVMSNEIWEKMTAAVAASRRLSVERLNELADTATLFCDAEFYKKAKLVDKLVYGDEVPTVIAAMMDVEDKDDYATIGTVDMANAAGNEPKDESGDVVAVYYAFGDIVQEASSGYGNSEIVGSKVARDLKSLAEDDDVKAVVLRVNSGGGSAYASEQIWHQVMNIKAEKPIIVSMGGMAASGGYYISCAADWIVAEPTTLTGSIGIFGMFPEASELLNDKLGIHFQSVKTNKYADFGDISRPMNAGEQALVQGYINRGYELFTKRCADGRKMKQDAIKAVAEGRVWTGVHAKKIGLVDQLGGLDDAIAVAKKKAGLDKCTVLSYPAKPSVFDQILNQAKGTSYADAKMQEALGDYYNMLKPLRRIDRKGSIEASVPYYLMFNL